MAQIKELKQKLTSVQSIRRVTKTMEMLARSRMQAKVVSVKKSKPFAADALYILGRITHAREIQHPYISEPKAGKDLIIAIGGDRGLCGGYHARIESLLEMFEPAECDGIAIGKKMQQALNRRGIPIKHMLPSPADVESSARSLSSTCIDTFLTGKYSRVRVLFNQFEGMFSFHTRELQLLPIDQKSFENILGKSSFAHHDEVYTLEPGEQAILNTVIPELITAMFEHIIKEAQAAEESSRMVAMKSATDNADRIAEDVRRAYNSARQQSITTEIAEIINGSQQTYA